jgi:Fur family ferric uptake transcriptional regulator
MHPADLRHAGLKATLPRMKILDLFKAGAGQHLSAEDDYRLLLETHSDIGMGTIYRVLSQLEHAGLLKRSSFQTGRAVYELDDGRRHAHLLCLDCGRIEEFHDEALEQRQVAIAAERGYSIQDHSLALYGSCTKPSCKHRPK